MKAYILPILGKAKAVLAIPGRGQYQLFHTKLVTSKIQEFEINPTEEEKIFIQKRNEYFISRRKDYVLRNSGSATKLFYLITPDCKGKCSYCYAQHSRDKNETVETFLSYEGFLQSCQKYDIDLKKITDIQVLGGEPLLYSDEIIKLATNHPDIIIGISTGLMLDQEKLIEPLTALGQLKNVSFSVSIDPNFSEYPRIYQGESFYLESLKRLKLLDSITPRWGIRSTISDERQDINNLEKDIRTTIGDTESFLAFTVDLLMGEAAGSQTASLSNLHAWNKEKVDTVIHSGREPLKDISIFENSLPYPVKHFFTLFRHFGMSVVQQQSCCDVVTERLAIDYRGTLNYCAESPMTEYADSWLYPGTANQSIVDRRVYASEDCHSCDIFQYCGGICFFNYEYYGVNKSQCLWWEHSAILAMYALFNYKEKYATLTEEDLLK
jgi:radical SAM protein with 4Fe4S-binding SPASM domain